MKLIPLISKKWCPTIGFNKNWKCLGYFNNPEEASRVYKEAAKELHKEFANIND